LVSLNFIARLAVSHSARVAAVAILLFATSSLRAQASRPEPDTVVFPNGEKLVGHFESFTAGAAKFKSDSMGEVTIDLSKVQELRTSQKYAVIKKGVQLGRGERDGQIPLGTLTVSNKTIQVDPGGGKPAQTVAVADLEDVVDEDTFNKAFGHPNILQKWGGAASVGVSLVEATQNSLSLTSSIGLVRAIPTEAWLPPRNRSLIDFSDTYGKVTQPGVPEVKTSIYHAAAERDEYFVDRIYALGSVAFDHNFSQGLDLQQLYGGGIGWSVIHRANETLDLKGTINYEKQQFQVASQDENLVNSVFAELYAFKFKKGIALSEGISVSPAWNVTRAYSANATVGLIFPVYKGFGFTVNAIDSYLNNPPTGFKKNSVQFSSGLSYAIP
jgi:Protein of unknown function, DUF481